MRTISRTKEQHYDTLITRLYRPIKEAVSIRDEAMDAVRFDGLTDDACSDRQRLIGSVKVRPFIPSLGPIVAHGLHGRCPIPPSVPSC